MSCSARNRKRNSGSTLDEYDKVSTLANADETECTSPDPGREPQSNEPDSQTEPEPEPEFGHLNETRRKIHDAIAALNDDSFDKRMARLLMQYEGAIREEFERAQYLPLKCRKLARILTGLTDVIHTMVQGRALQRDEGYRQRMCNIVGFYISCELCSAQEPVEKEEIIINRINSCLKLYVEYGDGGAGVHREHVLRTLLAAPKLFNRASILSMLYSRLFPHWSMPSVMIQAELPDKLYIEYILIFYYWQRLVSDESVKERIVEFAEKFMRPSRSLALKSVYAHYLPKFTDQNAATRTILNHLRMSSCTSLHVVSKVDNRPPQSNEVVLSSDDEDSCPMWDISGTPTSSMNNHPPVFLQNLCQNARQLEPCKRANALFSGIDNSIEIVELRDSDDDVEMFSVNFNVPANVDGINSNSNSNDSANQTSTTILGEDDSVPVTRIYPSNLRTYERAVLPPTTYTVPRIVNSYSCRRDSLHLVSTTAPHLVDQCVQTLDDEEPDLVEDDQYSGAHSHGFFPRSSNASDASGQRTPLYHCRQTSSQNSNCSESSLLKKQVTFSPRHLGATTPNAKTGASKKPSIKQYKPSSSNGTDSYRWKEEHRKASAKMFAKLDAKIKARSEAASQLTPTTSNASSSTPTKISATPTRIRNTQRGQRVALPTPPASTHSSSSPCQIRSASTDNHNSNGDLDFSRRLFSKAAGDEVSYYNHLLTLQRENIRRRRLNNQKKKKNRRVSHKLQNDDKLSMLKQATKRCRKLRASNAKRKIEVQQLEQDLDTIRKSAPHKLPIIRLKRCNLKSRTRSLRAEEAPTVQDGICCINSDRELEEQRKVQKPKRKRHKKELEEQRKVQKPKRKRHKKELEEQRKVQKPKGKRLKKVKKELESGNDLREQETITSQIQMNEKDTIEKRQAPEAPSEQERELDLEHQQFLEEQLLQEQHQLAIHEEEHNHMDDEQEAPEEEELLEDQQPPEETHVHVENINLAEKGPPLIEEDEQEAEDQTPNEQLVEDQHQETDQKVLEEQPPEQIEELSLEQPQEQEEEHSLEQEEEQSLEQEEEQSLEQEEEQSLGHEQLHKLIKPTMNGKRRKRRRRFKRPVWTHVKNKKKKQWLIDYPLEFEADPALDTCSIQPEPAPDEQLVAPVAAPTPEPAYDFDQDLVPEVGNELEIAAPIRVAEDEDSTALLSPSHNLELVTSHVPVYLLNGESRDVSTPLSSSSFSAGGSETYASSKELV
ncbi:uncharacterized protein LOC122618455 [Drosophila teissieri]|uniref:uncharacterized protein LOC122618455 n=1 Tax=Drosophila teissieri TaxID=7243 RepID=UPI001CBA15CB|nr:uncharacterized protein LOC122618455 [Drosophila teissieri]